MSEDMDDTGASPPEPSGQRGARRVTARRLPGGAQPRSSATPPLPGVPLEDAVRAFCEVLERGDLNIQRHDVRFNAEAIELTVGLALVREDPRSTRLRWRARVDEHALQQTSATHAVTIRLVPRPSGPGPASATKIPP